MKKFPLLLVLTSLFLTSLVQAQPDAAQITSTRAELPETVLVFFYGQGCPHCAKEELFLEEMQKNYPTLKVERYEVYFNKSSRGLFQELSAAYNTKVGGVPTTFINGKVITGFNDALGRSIEQEIRHCIEFGCADPFDKLEDISEAKETITIEGESSPSEDPKKTDVAEKLTIGAVITAAAVDAINPCAFAVLILLLTTILAAGNRRRVLAAGLAFSLSVYISYFLMGLGLFSAIQAAGLTHNFYAVVAVLAILVGLFNLKDYLWYGKWFIMEVPLRWRPKMKMLLKSVVSVPGAFFIGFVVSLFLLPCTSGPYIVILGLLAKTATRDYALLLLLLYNFIFILPMILITLAIYFGFTTTEQADAWRTRRIKTLHLIAGILMLLIGVVMFVAMWLGYV
jgi:cytochrome c biogenesis protein CcdA/glutaredoxin